MKSLFSASAVLLVALSPVSAQLATSHQTQSSKATVSVKAAGKPVVRVNGSELTDRDLLSTMYMMFPYARQHNGAVPKDMEAGIRAGAIKMMIFEELVYQEAERRKMTVPPAKLQKAESDYVRNFDSPAQFQSYLQNELHGSRQLLRSKIRRSLLIDQFLKTEVEQKSVPSPAELKAFYDKNPKRFEYGESFAIQTISILPPDHATPDQLKEARRRADDALKQAKETKTYEQFGLLAEKISDDDYRVMMGFHKSVERASLSPAIVESMLALKPDQMSGLIQVDNAYTIVRMVKHTTPGKKKFAEVKDSLRKELQKDKTEQLRSDLDNRLHQHAKIEML